MTNAERQRRHRARQANGRIVVRAEVEEIGLVQMLVALGLLDNRQQEDRKAIEEATDRLFAMLLADFSGRYA
jgi:hypothetical protein